MNLPDIFTGDPLAGLKGDSAKVVAETLNLWFAALRAGLPVPQLKLATDSLSAAWRADEDDNLCLYVGEPGAIESAQVKVATVDKATGQLVLEQSLADETTPDADERKLSTPADVVRRVTKATTFFEPGAVEDVRARAISDKIKDGAVSLAGYFLPIDIDYTNALKRALTASRSVQVPRGTFDISPQELNGLSGEIIGVSKRGSVLRWRVDDASKSLIKVTGLSVAMAFRNLTIDGRHSVIGDTPGYYAAIDFQAGGNSRLELDGVSFKDGRILDVRVSGPTDAFHTEFRMIGCTFEGGMIGTATRASACVQCQDRVHATWLGNDASLPELPATYGRAGFLFQRATGSPTTSYGTLVANSNRFRNMGRGDADTLGCIDVYSGANAVVINGNVAENIRGRAYSVKGDQSSIQITNNIARNCVGPAAATTPIVLFQDLYDMESDRGLIMMGNIVDGSTGHGFFVDGEGGAGAARFKVAIIAKNIALNCALDGIRVRFIAKTSVTGNTLDQCGGNGISVIDADDWAAVNDNQISNCSGHGIEFSNANTDADLVARQNIIRTVAGRGISLSSQARSYKVVGNDILGAALGLQTSGSLAASLIADNDFEDVSTGVWSKAGTDAAGLVWERNRHTAALSFTLRVLTISGGVIEPFLDWHYVETEGLAATDDVVTINGGRDGRRLTLYPNNNARLATLKATGGNFAGVDVAFTNAGVGINLVHRGAFWTRAA